MKEVRTFSLKNELGLHARAAAMLVAVSSKFKSKVIFERDGKEINGKSILGILTLACPKGSHITIRAEGDDALEVMQQLGDLIEGKFGED
ncbi:MAG: HPr family phosphocarrier protein [Deltaproteobacteria bacterium]|nr:HPr family phosphocarrier protein [Deltaproteobacteria bacterium]